MEHEVFRINTLIKIISFLIKKITLCIIKTEKREGV